jgi:TRAP-type mannitol/chloroaromatic compound transport system permease large subunit
VPELQQRGTMLSTGWSCARFCAPLPISCAPMIALPFIVCPMGMEIAWAIGIACPGSLFFGQFGDDPTPYGLPGQQMTTGVNAFVLLAIPVFSFAGEPMNLSGVTRRIVDFAASVVGHRRGGRANVGVPANDIMPGTSGSAQADASATGTVLIPEMQRRGFPADFSPAVIASAATSCPCSR